MMMKCPNCNHSILNQNINIQDNIAQCQHCESIFKASEALNLADSKFSIHQPPKGSWYKQHADNVIFGASTRSSSAFYLIPFTCVWSGFSLGSIYGSQIVAQEFSLFESLFGIPFLLGTLMMLKMILISIFGKVEIQADRNGGTIFTGIGSIGKKQSFLWREVSTINNGIHRPWFQRYDHEVISMQGASSYIFGGDLNEQRRYYLLSALKKLKAQYG